MTKPRPPFVWASDDEPDKWASDDSAADHFDTSKSSIERDPDKPPAIYIGRLRRRSCHAWNALARRRLEAALEAAALAAQLAAAGTPALPAPASAVLAPPEPPVRRKRGRPRRVVPRQERER